MKTFFTEAVVLAEHKVSVDSVPFGEGKSVAVSMMEIAEPSEAANLVRLRDSVLLYENPFQSISQDEWEAGA